MLSSLVKDHQAKQAVLKEERGTCFLSHDDILYSLVVSRASEEGSPDCSWRFNGRTSRSPQRWVFNLPMDKFSVFIRMNVSLSHRRRVAQAYLNEKKLDAEARQLQVNATNFSAQARQWLHLVESFSSALKEVGDVDNWARSIQTDLKIAETALEHAYSLNNKK